MTTKQTPPDTQSPSVQNPSALRPAVQKILAGQRAKQSEAERVQVADLYPQRSAGEDAHESDADGADSVDSESAKWARHVEWTLRLMS